MEEDAPPTDTLDEFDDGPSGGNNAGAYVGSPPASSAAVHSSHAQTSTSASAGTAVVNAGPSSNAPTANGSGTGNGQQQHPVYKLTIFGFPPSSSSSIVSHFSSIGNVVYNSLSDSSASASTSTATSGSSESDRPSGANWLTIGYDSEWSALRALRRNGEVLGGNCMIGVKWAEGSAAPSASASASASSGTGNAFPAAGASPAGEASPSPSTTTSASTSTFGTPATVLPASSAWLAKKPNAGPGAPPGAGGAAGKLSATATSRFNELGKMDPKIFSSEDGQAQGKKESAGVVGTLTNLIFGF